jgi:hypothetical protein
MTDYAAVLTVLYPGAQWTLDGDSYDGLTWLEDSPKPSQAELDGAWAEVQAQLAVDRVHRARQQAYQAESDPLFFAYQAGEGSKDEWEAARDAIKLRFPLP